MSNTSSSRLNESTDPAAANQALCADMSLLFTLLLTALIDAISRTGGKLLADQFKQQLNHYAAQHGWCALTGLTDLSELRHRVPDVDAKILLSVYLSYSQYARELGQQILGEPVLKSTLAACLKRLPPHLMQFNAQHGIIRLS
jgi:hypothetical protein